MEAMLESSTTKSEISIPKIAISKCEKSSRLFADLFVDIRLAMS